MLNWFRRKEQVRAPAVNFTPAAHEQLSSILARQEVSTMLRILVKNPSGGAPQYDMALEPADALRAGDTLMEAGGLRVVVDADSLSAVEGATVDFRDDPLQPGFLIEAARAEVAGGFDGHDPLAA